MIDAKKKYRTRTGREVRIYVLNGGRRYPVHGAIKDGESWNPAAWFQDGSWFEAVGNEPHDNDLIEVKPRIRREVWLNVYDNPEVFEAYPSKEAADRAWNTCRRLACFHVVIDCEEGEGL